MKRVSSLAHHFLLKHLSADSIIVDLTMGNGNDTLFACQHFKHVYAFDVQKEALQNTQVRCQAYTNFTLYHLSHADLEKVILEPVDAYIFNGGYLPHSESLITTQTQTTLIALNQAIPLLKTGGLLVLSFYRKHTGGLQEYTRCEAWLTHIKNIHLVHRIEYDNDALSPVLLVFKKL